MTEPRLKLSGMSMIKFTAELEPVPYKRPRFYHGRVYNERRYTDYKASVGYIAKQAMKGAAPLKGLFKISVNVYKNCKVDSLKYGDADNHLKAVLDALNGICFVDDRQAKKVCAEIFKGKPPRVEVELEELK